MLAHFLSQLPEHDVTLISGADDKHCRRYTGNQDFKDHNRDESGTNQQPFKGNNLQKYNTRSRGSSYTWTDECPVASSLQGGEGANTGIHAIVQGARDDEQRRM